MFLAALLGFLWMVSIILLVRNEFWQMVIAMPGSAAFLIGTIGGLIHHLSISWH